MFDAIVGNPPYQKIPENIATSKQAIKQARKQCVVGTCPIYHFFVTQAKRLNPQYISMIIPSKWISNEAKGLSSFKKSMFQDGKLKKLFDYEDSRYFFPTVNIGGGVCFFLWDRTHQSACEVTYVPVLGDEIKKSCSLDDSYIRDLGCLTIIEKVRKTVLENHFMHTMVGPQTPFGLRTYVRSCTKGDLILKHKDGSGPFPKELVTKNVEWIGKWKVMTTYLRDSSNHFPMKIFLTLEILPPNHICTETYLIVGVFDTKQEAENLLSYLKTKFARFLISRLATTQHLSKAKFKLVPIQDCSKPWSDKELYEKYNLTKEEIEIIETKIRPH